MVLKPTLLNFSNPAQAGQSPVTVALELRDDHLFAHFKVACKIINAKKDLARNEYPYDFDVVEIFVSNDPSGMPYFEFEVSPYNQGLQVNVVEPRQEYYFGVKNGYEHTAKVAEDGWEADMKIPLESLGWKPGQAVKLTGNVYAALGKDKDRVYWSLFPLPAGRPDFHVPSAFQPLFPSNSGPPYARSHC